MNKLSILFLALFLVCLPATMKADPSEKQQNDNKYLAGAVPEVDGKVVFSKEFQVAGMSREEIYDRALQWMTVRLKENKNIDSRVVYPDREKGIIAGVGEEWIVFSSTALSLDRTQINYQVTVQTDAEKCVVNLEKIRFTYREKEKYKAEEWITDRYALNKTKTKLVRGLAKWRKKTVDFADNMFAGLAAALGTTETSAREEKKAEEKKAAVASVAVPVAISSQTDATKAARTTAPEYQEADLKQIPGEIYALMGSGTLVISIGDDEFNMTNMTANAGGALGYLSGKAVAYCTLSPEQPFDAVEKAEKYVLKLYAPNEKSPSALIHCKKLPAQNAPQEGRPHTYVGEIVKLILKK